MKNDPFSTLAALDQQLFKDEQEDKQTSKLANKRASGAAGLQDSKHGSTEGDPDTTNQPGSLPSMAADKPDGGQAGIEARRTPVSQSSGHRDPVRIEARHTYDIFHDQVRWMNRMKLDIEDNYEEKVTINSIVKLALDILRDDFEANGEESILVRVLVFGRQGPGRRKKGDAA